mgnify:CR=1 FL=1
MPIVGFVSAGEGWTPFDGDGPVDEVDIAVAEGPAVALVVRGTSMVPAYRDGDVLIGTKRPTQNLVRLIGMDCIIETRRGERYVKFLSRGSIRGRYNLKSYNPAHTDIENADVAWAAPITFVLRAQR